MTIDIICISNPGVDRVIKGKKEQILFGGTPLTTACVITALGGSCGILGRIGKDDLGTMVRQVLQKNHVDLKGLRQDEHPTNQYTVVIVGNERRIDPATKYTANKLLTHQEILYLHESRALYLRLGSALFPAVAAISREHNIPMYVTGQQYKGQEYDLRDQNIAAILGSEDEIKNIVSHCRIGKYPIVTTLGDAGSEYFHSGKTITIRAYPTNCVDSTGAGDAFAGGYMFADIQGLNNADKLKMGNACGAIMVRKLGAFHPITRKQVNYFLNHYSTKAKTTVRCRTSRNGFNR